jgi:hypothetical protein
MTALVQRHFGLPWLAEGVDAFQESAIALTAQHDRVLGPDDRDRRGFFHCDHPVFGSCWNPPEKEHLEVRPQVQNARNSVRIDRVDTREVGQQPIVFVYATHATPHNLSLSRIPFPTLGRWRQDCGKLWTTCGYLVAVATGGA